jgi:hypothetical protein
MICCNYRGKITLLKEEDFRDWRSILMRDLTDLESAEFAMAVAKGIGRDGPKLRRWEKTFCKRLSFIDWVKLRDANYLFEDSEAQNLVDSFLEVYRFGHCYEVSLESDFVVPEQREPLYSIPDDADELITIASHHKRTLWDRILGRFGVQKDSIKILRSEISQLFGSGEDFFLDVGDVCYHFHKEGISVTDAPLSSDDLDDEAMIQYQDEGEEH